MILNDDEPIVAAQEISGPKLRPFIAGKAKVTVTNKSEAPTEGTSLKVLLELTGAGCNNDRPGVDIVTVLDVGENMMQKNKLENMKTAMRFLIKKLSPMDRLSIVTFGQEPERLCPLSLMTENAQTELEKLVIGLAVAGGGTTNMAAALKLALKVLEDQTVSTQRTAAIMLMSNGDQSYSTEALAELVSVPIYTFAFGSDYNTHVLNAIASNSNGGTFSVVDIENTDLSNLTVAFSQCLAGLLTVVVQDLKLTIRKINTKIKDVYAGNYPQSNNNDTSSVTISFGHLYNREVRKVLIELILPAVGIEMEMQVLQITYSYSVKGEQFEAPPVRVSVMRTGKCVEQEREEIEIEAKRIKTVKMMKKARLMADNDNLDEAQDKLVEAQNMLEDISITGDKPHPLIEMLKYELVLLVRLMQSQELYLKKGRLFALASETSHDHQRFAVKGLVEKLRLFATPRMNTYLEQVKSLDDDPSKALPTANEDVKQELMANPLARIIAPLSYHLQIVIQAVESLHSSLNSIQDLLNASRRIESV